MKLWQFDPDDRNQFRRDMAANLTPMANGVLIATLHHDARETVLYLELEPHAVWSDPAAGGAELLVLQGTLQESDDTLRRGSWLRVPDGDDVSVSAGPNGARFWIKTGHLLFAAAPRV